MWKAGLSKIKRSDVYGWSELDISDDKGRACTMATLVEGRHVLPSGSISMIKLNKAGEVVSTSALVAGSTVVLAPDESFPVMHCQCLPVDLPASQQVRSEQSALKAVRTHTLR